MAALPAVLWIFIATIEFHAACPEAQSSVKDKADEAARYGIGNWNGVLTRLR
jgi:hypothetical protein